ncbi:MAG TPA: lysophospholipase [Pseudobdellovibrionaceae bacterium]|nr:lysophospholipase [Pseudobdellovibrionaceae bacterium]
MTSKSDYIRKESYNDVSDKVRQFQQTWEVEKPRAAVMVTHGHGEHSDSYNRLIDGLRSLDFNFMSFDFRGHGRSSGRRGYVESIEDYISDIEFAFASFSKRYEKLPRFCIAHSMGCMIQTRFFLKHPEAQKQVLAQVLSSPFFGLSLDVPVWKKWGSNYLNRYLPKVTVYSEVKNEQLTHDKSVIREYERDTLRHTRVSPGAFLGFLESFEMIPSRAGEILLPTLLQVPENDPVVSTPISREWFGKLKNPLNDIYIYPNCHHEIYNEVARTTVYADTRNYLEKILKGTNS